MNAENALAVIKDVEKTDDKGMKEDDRRGWKRERPNHQTRDRSKQKDKKNSSNSKIHSISYAYWQNFGAN